MDKDRYRTIFRILVHETLGKRIVREERGNVPVSARDAYGRKMEQILLERSGGRVRCILRFSTGGAHIYTTPFSLTLWGVMPCTYTAQAIFVCWVSI